MYTIRLNILIIIIISLCCITNFTIAQQKGGRWQFENNGDDTAGWDQINDTGQLQGEAAFQTVEPLQEGSAYLMLDSSQVHDYVKVEDSDDLDFEDENIAISLWMYPLKAGDDVHYILNKGDQYTEPKTTNYALRISKNETIEFLIRDDQNKAQKVSSRFTVTVDQWNFVGVYYNYTEGMVYFWNQPESAAVDTVSFEQDYFSNDAPLAIGSWFRSDTSNPSIKDFEGRIDDVRIGTDVSHIFDDISSVDSKDSSPEEIEFRVYQCAPNPCNGYIIIPFSIANAGRVNLTVYNVIGQVKKTIESKNFSSGRHSFVLNVTRFSSGIYFYRIKYFEHSEIRKFIIMK
ncbi:MAG: LamG-like jellyroll fold domain-containing protein [bacterium]